MGIKRKSKSEIDEFDDVIEKKHVDLFEQEFLKYKGFEEFLVKTETIRIDDRGTWTVLMYDFPGKDPITGLDFWGVTKYRLYQELYSELTFRWGRRDWAKKQALLQVTGGFTPKLK